MSSEGQIQDPETKATDTPSPEIEVFEQHRHPTHIGEELRALLSLAIPVVLSELGWMTMTIVDLIMVGRLGPDAIGAVGLGNAVYYAPSLFGIGLLLGCTAFSNRRMILKWVSIPIQDDLEALVGFERWRILPFRLDF